MQKNISIITICKNSEKYLEDTIKSVISQDCSDYELIIVDGASTDNTIGIIQRYENKISKWISEPDQGIADAMNKGINLATGDYLLFLHSDDYLLSNNILGKILDSINDAKIQIFEIYFGSTDSLHIKKPRGFNSWMWFKYGIYHQAALCHKSVFNDIGHFDTTFKIAMDYDFFLRAYNHGISISKNSFPISVMRDTGISSQLDWPSLRYRFYEERQVQKHNKPPMVLKVLRVFFWPTYIFYRKLRSRYYSR